jgi:exosortase K
MNPMLKVNRKAAVQLVTVLTAAVALKQYYSTASANDLGWILWPTARLTELVTGTQFSFEPYAGYINSSRSFLIAAACAGINFLIAAFLLLSLRKIWSHRLDGMRWFYLPIAAISAYALTIVANTVRISSALWLNKTHHELAGLDRDDIHRLDGILVYFGCLLLMYFVNEKIEHRQPKIGFKHYLFPLAIYYAMTLAVPIMNGALRQGSDFLWHAAFVIAAPVVLIAAASVLSRLISIYSKRKNVAAVTPFLPADSAANEVRTRANIGDAAALSHRTIGLKCGPVVADR